MRNRIAPLTAALLFAVPAAAVDLPTEALVTVVEGIDVIETAPLDFGVVARSDGTVTIAAVDGSYADPAFIVYDAASISPGEFTVDSIAGATVDLVCTAGAMPAGLDLGAFTVEWAESGSELPVPDTHVLTARDEIMKLGASLTVTAADMPAPLGAITLPYTISVTFP